MRVNVTYRRIRAIAVAVEISITYSEYVFLALVIQHTITRAVYFIVLCGLSDSTIFFFKLINKQREFRGKSYRT